MRARTIRSALCAGAALLAAMTWPGSAEAADDHAGLEFGAGCSATAQDAVGEAVALAVDALAVAIADLRARDPDSAVTKAAELYFGPSTELATIAQNFGHIAARLDRDANPIRVICHPKDTDAFAWIPHAHCGTAGLGELHLGQPFFDALPRQGYDSRMGTIIHEQAHMAPGLGANCAHGRKERYGKDEVLMLGRLAPVHALDNAQNYEYFIESLYGR